MRMDLFEKMLDDFLNDGDRAEDIDNMRRVETIFRMV